MGVFIINKPWLENMRMTMAMTMWWVNTMTYELCLLCSVSGAKKVANVLSDRRWLVVCIAIVARFCGGWGWECGHKLHRLLCRLLDSPFLVFCCVVCGGAVDVVAAVADAASALFGRFRRIFDTCPRVQFPARLAPLLTRCRTRVNNAVTSNIDIL